MEEPPKASETQPQPEKVESRAQKRAMKRAAAAADEKALKGASGGSKAPAVPAGLPSPEEAKAFEEHLKAQSTKASTRPDLVKGLKDPAMARKAKFLFDATPDELFEEYLERIESPQEWMLLTVKMEKNRRGAIETTLGMQPNNMHPAAISARLEKAAAYAKRQYLEGPVL